MYDIAIYVAQGYELVNVSTDGVYAIIDKCIETPPDTITTPTLPTYLNPVDYPDTDDMTQDQAEAIIAHMATSEGASDGWSYR